ncbi:MAG: M48 family metallopeptidase [Pseudomonadota bacterium]|nr:MAG: M48 family metallopeptidase [Pseudomonadota bacterium]
MREIGAGYYDGRTSRRTEVRVVFYRSGEVRLAGPDIEQTFRLKDLTISPRVGNTPRTIELSGGAKCETLDNDAVDAVLKEQGAAGAHGLVHRLESRWRYVAVALIFTVAFVWGFVTYGIPSLARQVAFAVPPEVDDALGSGTLQAMDEVFFAESQLDAVTRERFVKRFTTMTQGLDDGHAYQLEFRASEEIGANAFALPSGIIVVTDELVQIAEDDDEVVGVLAHEIGHVVHRHGLRTVLQDSAVALLLAVMTGDIASSSSLAAALPAALAHAKYSREFETEADDYAWHYMREHNIPAEHFAAILTRMGEGEGDEEQEAGIEDYLSSHPVTAERVKRFTAEAD